MNYLICLTHEGKNNKILTTRFYQQPFEVYITNHKARLSSISEIIQPMSGRVGTAHSDSQHSSTSTPCSLSRSFINVAEMVGLGVSRHQLYLSCYNVVHISQITLDDADSAIFLYPQYTQTKIYTQIHYQLVR